MTKLQSAALSLVLYCLTLAGVTHLAPVSPFVRQLSIWSLAVVCFLGSLVFFLSSYGKQP